MTVIVEYTVKFTELQLEKARFDLGDFSEDEEAMSKHGVPHAEARAVEDTFLAAAPGFVTFPAKFAPVLIEFFEARTANDNSPERAEYRASINQCVARIKAAAGLE